MGGWVNGWSWVAEPASTQLSNTPTDSNAQPAAPSSARPEAGHARRQQPAPPASSSAAPTRVLLQGALGEHGLAPQLRGEEGVGGCRGGGEGGKEAGKTHTNKKGTRNKGSRSQGGRGPGTQGRGTCRLTRARPPATSAGATCPLRQQPAAPPQHQRYLSTTASSAPLPAGRSPARA